MSDKKSQTVYTGYENGSYYTLMDPGLHHKVMGSGKISNNTRKDIANTINEQKRAVVNHRLERLRKKLESRKSNV